PRGSQVLDRRQARQPRLHASLRLPRLHARPHARGEGNQGPPCPAGYLRSEIECGQLAPRVEAVKINSRSELTTLHETGESAMRTRFSKQTAWGLAALAGLCAAGLAPRGAAKEKSDAPAVADGEVVAWVAKRVEERQPSAQDRRFDQIGWAT